MKHYVKNECIFINQYCKTNDGLEINVCANRHSYWFIIDNDNTKQEIFKSDNGIDENFKLCLKCVEEKYGELIEISDKGKILEYSEESQKLDNRRNRMGCLESWYDAFYAMKETFTKEEVEAMSDNEINNLLRLASNIQEGLY